MSHVRIRDPKRYLLKKEWHQKVSHALRNTVPCCVIVKDGQREPVAVCATRSAAIRYLEKMEPEQQNGTEVFDFIVEV